VAVRDSSAFWLSSGNFNTSNQPDVDPSDQAALKQAIDHFDRDWHVICECPELAQVFEAYLKSDYEQATQAANQAVAVAGLAAEAPETTPLSPLDALAMSARRPQRFFPPKVIKARIKIKPLLTPDDYRTPILALIQGVKSRFYMQTQYIHTIEPDDDGGTPTHMQLITAVADLIKRGIDVRLITSEFQTKPWIEKLQDAGIDAVNFLRIQKNVHNKGIVVDSEISVVSSQNWSGEGTGLNRDAGLIIYNADAAKYFEEIFLHDWINLARPQSLL
jgi:phosphatidylserine/phosphatidylglycerophosphate/cardiolipin synthase-like enzyme